MEQDTVKDAHLIRITSHGKIRTWVEFALDFLDKNEDQPLTLHTLPLVKETAGTKTTPTTEQPTDTAPKVQRGKSSSTPAIIPRLITVAEIIKREHLQRLRASKSPCIYGVHQYNEIGCLEDLYPSSDLGVQNPIAGLKNVKIQRTVYMKITLCRKKLQHLVDKGATYQPPLQRQLSKSARHRARKKLMKLAQTNEAIPPQPEEGASTSS